MENFESKILSAKAYLFDFDGTIANMDQLHVKAYQMIFEKLGLQFTQDDFMEYISGKQFEDGMASYLAAHEIYDVDLSHFKREFYAYKSDMFKTKLKEIVYLLPGVKDFCDYLNQQNIPWGVVTSSARSKVEYVFDAFGITGQQFIVDRDSVEKGKPNPDPYLLGLSKLTEIGVTDVNKVIAFEDSRYGLMSSKAAGLYTVGILNKGWNDDFVTELSDYVIESYEECLSSYK